MTPDLIKGMRKRDVRYTTLVYKRQTISVRVGTRRPVNKTRKHDYEIHRDAVDARDWRDATRRGRDMIN